MESSNRACGGCACQHVNALRSLFPAIIAIPVCFLFASGPGRWLAGVASEPLIGAEQRRCLGGYSILALGGKGAVLCVVDGDVRWLRAPAGPGWTLKETDRGWTITCSRFGKRAGFLTVNGEGNVKMVADLNDGAYWKLTENEHRRLEVKGWLQASGGKFDGWYLSVSSQAEPVQLNGSTHTTYRVILAEKHPVDLLIQMDGP